MQTRVDEFDRYNGNFAISGGACYPKSHLSVPISNYALYNTICPTSLIQKRMLNGYRKFLDNEIFDTYHDDCIYSMICLVNGYYIVPSRRISMERPKELDRFGMHKMGLCKTDKEVIEIFERKFQNVTGKTLKQ